MSIKFDNELNSRMRNIVRNYNKRRLRLEKSGYTHVPPPALVSELKSRYNNRSELNKELNRLSNLSKENVLRKVENSGGVKAVEWEMKYLKNNLNSAKEYFEREYNRVSKRIGKFPGERTYLDAISSKINLLNLDTSYMTQHQFRSAMSAVNEFAKAPTNLKSRYRGFLSEAEWVMDRVGISEKEKDKFFNKFSKLTPTQFLYAYDNNPIIARIYNIYFKADGGEATMTTDSEDARKQIESLFEQADDIVNDAIKNMD